MKFVFTSLVLLLLIFPIGSTASGNYTGYHLIRVTPKTESESVVLQWARENLLQHLEAEIWSEENRKNGKFEVLLSPSSFSELSKFFNSHGVKLRVLTQDMGKDILNENPLDLGGYDRIFRDSVDGSHEYFSTKRYYRHANIRAFLYELQENHPDLVHVEEIGKSHENRLITLVKICSIQCGYKPAIWIDGGIHAREWIAPATALYFIEMLVKENYRNREVRDLLDFMDFYILPVVNPDGYDYSHTKDRLWRKNRSPCLNPDIPRCCRGVDLNRNFDWKFMDLDSSSNDPCTATYRGTEPFSEPESRAVRDAMIKYNHTIQGFLTMHSYAQAWMYPYSHEKKEYPANRRELHSLARNAVAAIKSVYRTNYRIGSPADIFYPAGGGSSDWAKGVLGTRWVYGLELTPCGRCVYTGFILPARYIKKTGRETWAAIAVVAREILRKNGTEIAEPEKISTTRRPSNLYSRFLYTTKAPTPGVCEDLDREEQCLYWKKHKYCGRNHVRDVCQKTCEHCVPRS